MRFFIIIILLCLLPVAVLAEQGEIPCIRGNCEGWTGSYENENDVTTTYTLHNNTGKPAFKINCRLLFFTYLDDLVTTIQNKIDGPIVKEISFIERWPDNAAKVQFEIYWSEEP